MRLHPSGGCIHRCSPERLHHSLRLCAGFSSRSTAQATAVGRGCQHGSSRSHVRCVVHFVRHVVWLSAKWCCVKCCVASLKSLLIITPGQLTVPNVTNHPPNGHQCHFVATAWLAGAVAHCHGCAQLDACLAMAAVMVSLEAHPTRNCKLTTPASVARFCARAVQLRLMEALLHGDGDVTHA